MIEIPELILPNVRKLFIPDPGYTIFDCDLAGADAQVVAWEAEDDDLKAAFRAGVDVHAKNATDMWGNKFTRFAIDDPKRSKLRKQVKQGVHATNYGVSARTLAMILGWTVKETEDFMARWFSLHPGVLKWHKRTQADLDRNKTVTNAFGFRRIYTDRADLLLPQALAWKPQSTVAIVCAKAMNALDLLTWVQMLIQVHDSNVFQIPTEYVNPHRLRTIKKAMTIPIPYEDPLTIPFSLSYSTKSWGDCQKQEWPT